MFNDLFIFYAMPLVFILDTLKPLLQKWISAGETSCIWTGLDSAGTAALLCLMGAPGPPGSVGQMGCQVPGPIWVLNGLSSVRLPSWFRSHATQSSACSTLPDYPFRGVRGGSGRGRGSHQVCFNLGACLRNITWHHFGRKRADGRRAETRSPGSARPHSHPSICFKRFHIGAIFRSCLFILASSGADSLIDRTQKLTGLCKIAYVDVFLVLLIK